MPKSNTAADIDMTGDKEPETKPKGNNPTSRTKQKVASGEVHSSDAVQGDVLLEQEINNQSKADIIPVKSNELEESGGSGVTPGVDVEMNEENKEDKVPDVMQTEQESPLKQSPSVVQVFILIKQLVLFELELNVWVLWQNPVNNWSVAEKCLFLPAKNEISWSFTFFSSVGKF